jgi:hypothetical protein
MISEAPDEKRINDMRTCKCTDVLIIVLFMASWTTIASAEVRSGIWLLVQPSKDSLASQVDFSGLTAFCPATSGGDSICRCEAADCYFRSGHIVAPGGVYYDSTLSVQLEALVAGKTIRQEYQSVFYLDSMMKKIRLSPPQGATYVDSISCQYGRAGVFFIKTRENRYAFMFKVMEYIGGYDRMMYYWAYQPDTGRDLFKQRIFEYPGPGALQIEMDVFSGRQNPIFTLNDAEAISDITRQLFTSINTLLDSTIVPATREACPSPLGYRKLLIKGWEVRERFNTYFPTVELCAGNIIYHEGEPWLSAIAPLMVYDRNLRLVKLITDYCCKNNLSATDAIGTVKFCDLIPDSLKTLSAAGDSHRAQHNARHTEPVVSVQGRSLRISGVNNVRSIDLFSLAGERIYSFTGTGGDYASLSIPYVNNRCFLISLLRTDGRRTPALRVALR